ncbi:hypothetical protein REPUB_Repub08aG0108500 [Reevesia pubescens]
MDQFCLKYGQIAYILSFDIEEQLVNASIQLWDPSYRCFFFNKEYLVPTIEEYSTLLGIHLMAPDKIYVKRKKMKFHKILRDLIGVGKDEVNCHVKNKSDHTSIA